MKKGTKVSWQINGAPRRGHGIVISEEDNGHVLVSVEDFGLCEPESVGWSISNVVAVPIGIHPVIHCTVTWLTIES